MRYGILYINIMITDFKEVVIFTNEMRYSLTIDTIKYSDSYDDNFDLFNQGIKMLEARLKTHNFEEFNVDEQELLEQIFQKINEESN